MTKEDPVIREREKLCARLGFRDIMNVHEFLMKSRNSPGALRSRMLNHSILEKLGYNKSVLKQYGGKLNLYQIWLDVQGCPCSGLSPPLPPSPASGKTTPFG